MRRTLVILSAVWAAGVIAVAGQQLPHPLQFGCLLARLFFHLDLNRPQLRQSLFGRRQLGRQRIAPLPFPVARIFLRIHPRRLGQQLLDPLSQRLLLLGHLPALLHADPRRALVVGLGSGVTAGALAAHPLREIDVAELEPAVLRASRFFDAASRAPLDDPRVRVILDDARHVVARHRQGQGANPS